MPNDPPAPIVRSKAESLAETSFALGIASIVCGVTAIPAMICSIRALRRIRKDGASKTASRKAIFGLVFSFCILGFILFCFLSALGGAKSIAVRMNCINNLKQLGLAMRIYADDHRDTYPTVQWCDILLTNKGDLGGTPLDIAKLLRCPAAPKSERCSYALNRQLVGVKDWSGVSPDTVLLFDSDAGWNALGGPEIAALRHYKGLNIVRVDGSADQIQIENFSKLRWNPYTNNPAK